MANDILILDDEDDIRLLISGILEDEGYDARVAWDLKSLKAELNKRLPSLILLDVWLEKSKMDGMELLHLIKTSYKDIPVIMISGHGTIDMAVQAIKKGAFDFIEKPFDTNVLLMLIDRALELEKLKKENQELWDRSGLNEVYIGDSPPSLVLRSLIQKVSITKSRVLIKGSYGVGKQFIARMIHNLSDRKKESFIIAKTKRQSIENLEEDLFGIESKDGKIEKIGLLEQAHNGTLYIDEVSNLDANMQARIVKLLAENVFTRKGGSLLINVNIRVLAGTTKNLPDEIKLNSFREDLYYRLSVVPIDIPSLNKRSEDIPALVEHFMGLCSKNLGLAPRTICDDAITVLQSRDWVGNVKELRGFVEQLLLVSPEVEGKAINASMLPREFNLNKENSEERFIHGKLLGFNLKEARVIFEKEYLSSQMLRFNNNVSRTAKFIGMERSALHRKLKVLNII